jgi:hypothetical protein
MRCADALKPSALSRLLYCCDAKLVVWTPPFAAAAELIVAWAPAPAAVPGVVLYGCGFLPPGWRGDKLTLQ